MKFWDRLGGQTKIFLIKVRFGDRVGGVKMSLWKPKKARCRDGLGVKMELFPSTSHVLGSPNGVLK